ncbi:MAG TPA: hypothetical protein DCS15_00735 [Flavobacteriales bacterium]|nr:hypothetical protein [Flavobacteriales bacterium]
MELDTNLSFESPFKQSKEISSSGGVLRWKPNLEQLQDSTVVYWRCSPNNFYAKDMKWRHRSFQVIDGKLGWGQSHFDQLESNSFQFLEKDDQLKSLDFAPVKRVLVAQNRGNPSFAANFRELYDINFRLDGQVQGQGVCGAVPSMHIAFFNPINLQPIPADSLALGHVNQVIPCSNFLKNHFMFNVKSQVQLDSMAHLLTDLIPDGSYILAYSAMRPLVDGGEGSQWTNQLFTAFEDLGADSLRYVGDSLPFLYFTRKGDPSVRVELIGKNSRDVLNLYYELEGSANFGQMSSTQIGPIQNPSALYWKAGNPGVEDSLSLDLNQLNGSNFSLKRNYSKDSLSDEGLGQILNDEASLQLGLSYFDDLNRSFPGFNYWYVLHDGIPEVAIDAKLALNLNKTEVSQGEHLKALVGFRNLGEYPLDSLVVHYWLVNESGEIIDLSYEARLKLDAGAIRIDSFDVATKSLEGEYVLYVEVNPKDSLWQVENAHFNNKSSLAFKVSRDRSNPILDVTFDGIHILDGDLVSSKPDILIQLSDENPFLVLDDTASMDLYLTYPNGTQKRIPYSGANQTELLTFEAGTNSKNEARVNFNPELVQDGKYVLSVYGKDVSENSSGENDYSISFEVLNRSTLTRVVNYPNPFSTSTRFVFTLTGSILPEVFRIQVFTTSGKLVRDLDLLSAGQIRIGRNVSELRWDGTDEYGDRLANGVYLFRVISKIDGEDIEQRTSEVDQYFRKGFGKMVLIR